MAVGAGINLDLLEGGTSLEGRTAGSAGDGRSVVSWMDVFFHVQYSFRRAYDEHRECASENALKRIHKTPKGYKHKKPTKASFPFLIRKSPLLDGPTSPDHSSLSWFASYPGASLDWNGWESGVLVG